MISPQDERSLDQPSVVGAVERMFEAAQRLIIERIDLAKLEAQEAVSRAVRMAIFGLAGGVLAFTGWLALMAMMVLALRDYAGLQTPISVLIVGVVHIIGGVALVLYGAKGKTAEQRG